MSVLEVARQAGHSPEECLRTYAHVFEEFDPADRTPAEERIRAARAKSGVHDLYIAGEPVPGEMSNSALRWEADARIRTGDPFITSEVLWPAELRRR